MSNKYDFDYDIIESKDIVEKSEFIIIDYKEENTEESRNLEDIYEQKNIPTFLSHPLRFEPRIPLFNENIIWISIPKVMLTEEFQNLCNHQKYPKTKSLKEGYINIPEEWIYYKGNPAFTTDDLLRIFSKKQ